MDKVEWIGIVAGICTTCAYMPQAVKTLRTRDTASLSLCMYALMSLGVGLWLIYGIMIESFSVIAANAVSLVMTGSIFALKLKHG